MSTRAPVSLPTRAVVDTVVLRYFLFVDQAELLLQLLGRPIVVPEAVYSTQDEHVENEQLLSEMVRSIRWHERFACDQRRPRDKRDQADRLASRLALVHELVARGDVVVEQLSETELSLFARLTSIEHVAEYNIVAPLGTGEAACIAIAHERSLTLVTDDNDGLRAFGEVSGGGVYERIRRLLVGAADEGHIDRGQANLIHREMVELGFYDRAAPFPAAERD